MSDPTPAELAAMPLSQWRELEKSDPDVIERVLNSFEAGERAAARAPDEARAASERVAEAGGNAISRSAHLTELYLRADAERRAARAEHAAEEVRRSRPQESFAPPPTQEGT
jgi:ABC-type nitrate/sulfonate/bicarbonate transport system substrate-binding protein